MGVIRGEAAVSELEREIELEMDDELEGFDNEEGLDNETDPDAADGETEDLDDGEFEAPGDDRYTERFLEIAAREFESESEVDLALNEVLDDVAREYLFGTLWKKARRFGQNLAHNKTLGSLVRKGLSVASGQFPALKAAMQLAKGNLQGALLNLGKQAIGTAIPGGSAALGALSALGVGGGAQEREVWENYGQIAREAFEHLANNVTERADQPIEANRLAANAFQHAVGRAQARTRGSRGGGRAGGARKVTHYRLERGEKLVVTGPGTVVVRGA